MKKDMRSTEVRETADVEILDPRTTEGFGVFFILAGPDHPMRRSIELARDRKMRLEIKKKGRIDLGDPEEDRRQEVDYLVACTLGWYTVDQDTKERSETIYLDGRDLAHSPAAVRAIYEDKKLSWIRKQVREDLKSDEVFLQAFSANSSATPSGTSASSV